MSLSGLDLLSIALVVAMAGSVLLNKLPGPCQCEKCGFHVNERRMDAERERASRHRTLHFNYPHIPWGDERCMQCKLGHEDDVRG